MLNSVKYNDLAFRFCAALFAAHKIVTINEKESFFEFLFLAHYYPALFGSFIIAFILIEIIYKVTYKLDQRYPWEEDLVNRLLWQIMLGVVLTATLAIVLAISYFSFFEVNIKETLYFDSEFFVIVLLILLCNLYYLVHYLFKVYVLPAKTREENKLEFEQQVPDFSEMDVVLIYSQDHNNFALTVAGEHLVWPYSIKKSEQYLSGDSYFMINRWCIVRKDIIDRAVRMDVLRDDKVLKSIPYEVHLKIPFHKPIITSYRRAGTFNKWLNG